MTGQSPPAPNRHTGASSDGTAAQHRARHVSLHPRPDRQHVQDQRPEQQRPGRSLLRPSLGARALTWLFWATVAMTLVLVILWGGPGQWTWASAITSAGTIAGLLGTDLVLVMVFLAARVPWVDRVIGHDVALGRHRRLGAPALYLILAHFILLTVGRAAQNQRSILTETAALVVGPDDTGLAYVGLAIFLLVVLTSAVGALRRRLPKEGWFAIHLLSYVGIISALPHQSVDGAVLVPDSGRYVYWLALYAVAFGALVTFRVLLPIARSLRYGIRVSAVERLGQDVVSLHLAGRGLDRLGVRGGQYAIWRFWSASTWWHSHPISFSALPTSETTRLTVRAVGAGSHRLTQLGVGTRVGFSGPYGRFTPAARTRPTMAVLAAGVGITPVRALLEDADLRPGEATVVLRASSEADQYLWAEVEALTTSSGSDLVHVVGPRPAGQDTWLSAQAVGAGWSLLSVIPDLMDSDVYVCGPPGWTAAVVAEARAAGLSPEQIHADAFSW